MISSRQSTWAVCFILAPLLLGVSASKIMASQKEIDHQEEVREPEQRQSERLPEAAQPKPLRQTEDPTVTFAGGSVSFAIPFDWQVSEIAEGRQIRLAISPEPLKKLTEMRTGAWFAFYHAPRGDKNESSLSDLQRRAQDVVRRLGALGSRTAKGSRELDQNSTDSTKQIRLTEIEPIQISGLLAVRQLVEIIESVPQTGPSKRQGVCVLARCGEAIFEMYAVAPADSPRSASEIAEHILRSLTLTPPKESADIEPPIVSTVADAQPIVGSWKALRSQLAFRGDGKVRLQFDQEKTWLLAAERPLDSPPRIRQITGTFQANGDVVTIVWSDGSRLNYRWRLSHGRLYLTDHLGRVSQLHRLYQ